MLQTLVFEVKLNNVVPIGFLDNGKVNLNGPFGYRLQLMWLAELYLKAEKRNWLFGESGGWVLLVYV